MDIANFEGREYLHVDSGMLILVCCEQDIQHLALTSRLAVKDCIDGSARAENVVVTARAWQGGKLWQRRFNIQFT